jgi:hypothetical protein
MTGDAEIARQLIAIVQKTFREHPNVEVMFFTGLLGLNEQCPACMAIARAAFGLHRPEEVAKWHPAIIRTGQVLAASDASREPTDPPQLETGGSQKDSAC